MSVPHILGGGASSAGGAVDAAPPALESRRIRLREMTPSDYPILYRMAMDPALSFRWRFRARQVGFEEFVQSLKDSVLCQFVVLAKPQLEVIGLVVCYRPDFRNRHAYLAFQGAPSVEHTGLVMEAGELLVDYLFACFDFDKLYAECPEFSLSQYRSGMGQVFVEEGCLRNHERFLGRSWDFSILAVHRSTWMDRKQELARRQASDAWRFGPLRALDGDGLAFDEFVAALAEEVGFDRDGSPLLPGTRIREDLGLDSIGLLQVAEVLDGLGVELDAEALMRIETLGDLHFTIIQATRGQPAR